MLIVKKKSVFGMMLTILLMGTSYTMLNLKLVAGWSNGGYSSDPNNPNYGTHDWIAQHALDWLPSAEKEYVVSNLAIYLYGTELPDNSGAPDGIGDTALHHIYYWSNESLQDDVSATRAQTEYSIALSYIKSGNVTMAVKTLGIMSHYIVDVGVFGHVMGSGTDWGPEVHHSDYENYVNDQTNSYDDAFNAYLAFDGSLDNISAYDAACTLAYDTTFDVNGNLTCVWMDQNYDWSNQTFKDRCGESLNLAVNLLADVLHTFYMQRPYEWTDWTHYHDYSGIVDVILYLNSSYPTLIDVFSIGKSWQNRDIYCIRLTNESNTHPKPKLFFVGYHHARELISAELALYFAVEAATNFSTNETITHMLNYSEIYIIPALNVDGFNTVKQNEWQRKNAHPFDEDNDTLLDEDPPEDVDGDGYIEDLIQWDGYQWVFVRWEGTDSDSDGSLNEDWVGGVDLNRNYGYEWDAACYSGSPYPWAEDYRGPAPFSEPETQAMRDLALSNDFRYAISFHSGSESIGYPWGYTADPTPDDNIFRQVASNLSALVGAPYGQSALGMYTLSGSWDDWMYANRSTFALTCEIYTNNSAWQYEPGPEPDTLWEKGVFQFFNPDPSNIETVVQRWLPVFTYTTDRAITEAYDIATTNTSTLKAVVGQGYLTNIIVTVTNQGLFTETFNVTVYANTTSIASQDVTLSSRSSTTITFTWNTSGFVKGNYTISAYAWPIQGETDTADNTLADGWIIVSMVGDITGPDGWPDGKCDMRDVRAVAKLFGINYPDPRYDPNCDINDDLKIDMKDVRAVAKQFGKTDP
jgi:hypothetical protein